MSKTIDLTSGIATDELSEIFRAIAHELAKAAERLKELYDLLSEKSVELSERQKFTPCLQIGTPRNSISTCKLWQKNKALYLCPYMPKSLRNKKQAIKEAFI